MNLLSAIKSVRLFPKREPLIPLTTVWGENLDSGHVREEYPRPQLVRENYTCLNGYWDYTITSTKRRSLRLSGKILVPFSPEAPLSGVNHTLQPDELLTCQRELPLDGPPENGQRCILHFGAADQWARVLVNGHQAVSHTGGYLPFSADITELLQKGRNLLTVQIRDVTDTSYHSVGKQRLGRGGMFYTAQSGLWQPVWMETVPAVYIRTLLLTPCYDKETVHVSLTLNRPLSHQKGQSGSIVCHVSDADGKPVSRSVCTNQSDSLCSYSCYCDVNDMQSWTPDSPYLYHMRISTGEDQVESYFAMRTFTIEPDSQNLPRFCLNHKPLFLQGVLNQGYWPDGLYTAPSDEAFVYDITQMKKLGFNMIRMHAKVECARWYYHCDRLGMIVWQDMVNGGHYHAPLMTWFPALFPWLKTHLPDTFCPLLGRRERRGRQEFEQECLETVRALAAFPCISTWVLFNEGWGQFQSVRLTRMLKELDTGRLVDSASGWFDRGQGDFKSEHNYFDRLTVIPDKRAFVLSEYGGYACPLPGHISTRDVYGYRRYQNLKDFQTAYTKLMKEEVRPLVSRGLCGAVYTQVSDIEEETNGLLTYDRKICKLDSGLEE